jgi:hypothetical protein
LKATCKLRGGTDLGRLPAVTRTSHYSRRCLLQFIGLIRANLALAHNCLLLYVLKTLTSIISTRIQPCNRSQIWHRDISLGSQKEWPSIQRKESAGRSIRTREIVGVGLKICTWCLGV